VPDLDLGPEDYRDKGTGKPPPEPLFTANAPTILAVLFMLGMFGWLASQTVAPILKAVIVRSLVALGAPEPTERRYSPLLPHHQLSGCPQRFAGAASNSVESGSEAPRHCE
jgi:hypothetical protein